jgi:hypothetical protein
MSAFTERLYLTWLRSNGCVQSRRGYGAQPHGRRREGYPTDQRTPLESIKPVRPARPVPGSGATSRDGSPRAIDAVTRPEKPAVLTPKNTLFCPQRKNLQSNQPLMDLYIV